VLGAISPQVSGSSDTGPAGRDISVAPRYWCRRRGTRSCLGCDISVAIVIGVGGVRHRIGHHLPSPGPGALGDSRRSHYRRESDILPS